MPEKKEPQYISLQEATKYCPYSQEYLSLIARQGKLRSIKIGRNWVTTEEWTKEYVARMKEGNNQNHQKEKSLPVSQTQAGETASEFSAKEFEEISQQDQGKGFDYIEGSLSQVHSKIRFPERLPAAILVALFFVLLAAGGVFGKESLQNAFGEIEKGISQGWEGAQQGVEILGDSLLSGAKEFTLSISRGTEGIFQMEDSISQEVGKSFGAVLGSISQSISLTSRAAIFTLKETADISSAGAKQIGGALAGVPRGIGNILQEVGQGMGNFVFDTGERLGDFAFGTAQVSNQTLKGIGDVIGKGIEGLGEGIEGIGKGIQKGTQGIGKGAKFITGGIIEGGKVITKTSSDLGSAVLHGANQGLENLADGVNDIGQGAKNVGFTLRSRFSDIAELFTRPFKKEEVVIGEERMEGLEKKVAGLSEEFEKLRIEGLPIREIISEVTQVTRIEPIREITRETIKIDEGALADVRTSLAAIDTRTFSLERRTERGLSIPNSAPPTSFVVYGDITEGGTALSSKYISIPGGSAQGDILVGAWTRLPAGVAGQFLQTQGAGANPVWINFAAGAIPLPSANILVGNAANVAAAVAMSGDVAINNAGATTIQANAVALTADTTGNYVASLTNGSGIAGADGGSEGAALTLALGALTADWNQTGAFDISLNNAGSELKILESVGAAFFAILDAGDLAADQTFTFTTGGTVYTSGNDPLDTIAEWQALCADCVEATDVGANSVALTTDTTGNYVASLTNGSGIAGGDGGSEGAALTLALGALTADWNQTGAFDISLNNAGSELKILESVGAAFFGIFDVTDLTADRTYTFPDITGTVALTANNLSVFAATTSLQLLTLLSDETGTGAAVFANTPTLVTPVIGAATGTSLATSAQNIFTAAAATAPLILRSATATDDDINILPFAGGAGRFAGIITSADITVANKTWTFPDITGTVALLEGTQTFSGAKTFSSAIAANAGITFDNATDTLGAFTAAGTIDMNTNILTNIGNAGTDFIAATGGLTLAGAFTANGASTFNTDVDFVFGNSEDFTITTPASTAIDTLVSFSLNPQITGATTNRVLYLTGSDQSGMDDWSDATGDSILTLRALGEINDLIGIINNFTAATTITVETQHANTPVTLDNGILFSTTGPGTEVITDAINVSNADIVNAINVGANVILGTTATIDFTNFDVSSVGAVVAVGVNSGSGLLQGTGGLTITGAAVSLNASSNFATNINTGTANTLVSIGGGSGTFALNTTNIDISSAGAITGATGVSTTTVTASAAIAANGGITFDQSTDTLGAFTAAGTINLNTNILTNIGNAGTDFIAATGGLTLAGAFTANGVSTFNTDVDFVLANTENFVISSTVGSGQGNLDLSSFTMNVDDAVSQTQRVMVLTAKQEDGDPYAWDDSGDSILALIASGPAQDMTPATTTFTTGMRIIANSRNAGSPVTITDGILVTVDSEAFGTEIITDAIDVSETQITNAINVGANTILGTTAVINFTNFDVASTGAITPPDITSNIIGSLDATINVIAGRTAGSFYDADGYPVAGSQALCDGGAFNDIADCSGAPSDYAEYYATNGDLEPGDVVSSDVREPLRAIKSSTAYDTKMFGIISTFPWDPIGADIPAEQNPKPVALAGRVPIKVSLENGPIRIGDKLTSTSTPGVAMKATEPGPIIGIALENYDGSIQISDGVTRIHKLMSDGDARHTREAGKSLGVTEEEILAAIEAQRLPIPPAPPEGIGKILVFVNISYYLPTENLESVVTESGKSVSFVDLLFSDIARFFTEGLKKLGLFVENGIAKVQELFADKITTKQLCVEDICVDREQLKALLERSQTQIIIQNYNSSVDSGQIAPQSGGSTSEPPVEQPSAEESPTEEQPVVEPVPSEPSMGEQPSVLEPPAEQPVAVESNPTP